MIKSQLSSRLDVIWLYGRQNHQALKRQKEIKEIKSVCSWELTWHVSHVEDLLVMLPQMWETRGAILPPHAFHWQPKAAHVLVDCNSHCILTCTSGLGSCQVSETTFQVREYTKVYLEKGQICVSPELSMLAKLSLNCWASGYSLVWKEGFSHLQKFHCFFIKTWQKYSCIANVFMTVVFAYIKAKKKVQGVKNCNERTLITF